MNNIQQGNIPADRAIPRTAGANRTAPAQRVNQAAIARLKEVEARAGISQKAGVADVASVRSAASVEARDIAPLANKTGEEVMAHLSRILNQVDAMGRNTGQQDPVAMLCKTMLSENLRRMEMLTRAVKLAQ